MSEEKLDTYWAADRVPTNDFAFTLRVMARIEARAFRQELLFQTMLVAGFALVLALTMASFESVWRDLSPFAGNLVVGAALLAITIMLPQWLRERMD